MKKAPHIIWVCPNSKSFYRSKGEVRCRPGSVIPKLSEHGIRVNILIPNDPTLLPKTKLSPTRVTRHAVQLSQPYPIEIVKLTRGAVSPGVYMVKTPTLEAPLSSAVFSKASIILARQLNRPVDIFHLFDWESALVPLFLELENNGNRLFRGTKTFLNVHSFKEQGNFAPSILKYLNIPQELFHPDGIEFYGKVSFLKSGLIFSDGIGVVEDSFTARGQFPRNGNGLDGVLDSLTYKLRRWASDRSLRSHLDAYKELLSSAKSKPLLPHLLKKLSSHNGKVEKFVDSWGPVPSDHYDINAISFLMQSPHKAYAFWEWTQPGTADFGLVLENVQSGERRLLRRGLSQTGDYWIDVNPDHVYVIELVGWSQKRGGMRPLLRSRPLRISRENMSPNTYAEFIDVRSRRRYGLSKTPSWENQFEKMKQGGTSAWAWAIGGLSSSSQGTKK